MQEASLKRGQVLVLPGDGDGDMNALNELLIIH